MIDAGKYNRLIDIVQMVKVRDAQGFDTETPEVVLSVWAQVKTTKGMTLIANDTDFEKAFTCFLKAAEKGDLDAEYRVGRCYKNGIGVVRNVTEAINWFQKAAGRGHVEARALHTTRVYRTATDGGINCGVWFGGYMKDATKDVSKSGDKGTAIELVANMFEYGSKHREYPKHPFLRKSFHKREIERAMLKAQKKYITDGGDLK